tara:strand:- start:2526 stop:4043 length:1518 start_codon:yes stop_codon:yes gene_type:complete
MSNLNNANILMDVIKNAKQDNIALKTPEGITLTYANVLNQINRINNQLQNIGVTPGDRIAMILPNAIETVICFISAASVGTAAPLNPGYKRDELEFYLDDTDAKVVIVPEDFDHSNLDFLNGDVNVATVVVTDEGEVSLKDIDDTSSSRVYASSDDVALVLHTSGTTSRPKRVPLKHSNLLSSISNIADTYNLNNSDVSLCVMPLFHVHGLVASLLSTLATSGTVVIPSGFNPLRMNQWISDFNVTWYTAVPTMHQTFVNRIKSQSKGKDAQINSELRFIRSCSSSLAPILMDDLESIFQVPVLEAYGMTEASHQMSSNPLPPSDRLPGSVGTPTGIEIAIMDEEGNLLENHELGEVVIKGKNVIDAYEDNPEANSTAFTNGWFRTGDQGVIDDNGYLSLTGRLKELINRSGEKISPREIDEALMDHPKVAEAVAFGAPSTVHGEEPSAAVVVREEVTEQELISFVREKLANFKCPRRIYIVESIPRTATGKIQRRLVSEELASS